MLCEETAWNTTALIYRVRWRDWKSPINPNTISSLPSWSFTILHIFHSTPTVTYGQTNQITLSCSLQNRFPLYHHSILPPVVRVLATPSQSTVRTRKQTLMCSSEAFWQVYEMGKRTKKEKREEREEQYLLLHTGRYAKRTTTAPHSKAQEI